MIECLKITTDMSQLATRLAIALIDRRLQDARTLSSDPDFVRAYNDFNASQDAFERLLSEAKRQKNPLIRNKSGCIHDAASLRKALSNLVTGGNLRSGYDKSAKVIYQYGSIAVKPEAWEKLCTVGGFWSGDMAKETALLDHVRKTDEESTGATPADDIDHQAHSRSEVKPA